MDTWDYVKWFLILLNLYALYGIIKATAETRKLYKQLHDRTAATQAVKELEERKHDAEQREAS